MVYMYTKQFDEWNTVKKQINARNNLPHIHERAVWYCSVGVNVGYEIDGKHANCERPIIILKIFDSEYFWGIPLTSAPYESSYYYPIFLIQSKRLSYAVLPQMKLFDRRRLLRQIDTITTLERRLIGLRIADLATN